MTRKRAKPHPVRLAWLAWLAEDMPVSIPPEDLTEYEYEMNLLDRWTPPPPADTMDISNKGG